jgi:hypothetical protein
LGGYLLLSHKKSLDTMEEILLIEEIARNLAQDSNIA